MIMPEARLEMIVGSYCRRSLKLNIEGMTGDYRKYSVGMENDDCPSVSGIHEGLCGLGGHWIQ